jgi:tetratricopeptide (TPR) repeat protein
LALIVIAFAGTGALFYGYALHRWHAARTALESGRQDEARIDLAFCLAVWPGSSEVHLLAARAARLAGDVPAAQSHLKQCLKLRHGSNEDAQLEFLLLRAQTGEEEEVAPELFWLVENRHPQTPLILETVARAYIRRVRYVAAEACLSRWIELTPETAKAYHWRGWVREHLDNPKEARADYQKVLELDPDVAEVRLRVAELLLEDNQPGRALPHLEKLTRSAPDGLRAKVRARLGQCRLLQGDSPAARQLLEAAVEQLADDVPLLLHLGKLELQEDRPARAESWLRRAWKVDPMDTEVQFNLACSLEHQLRWEEAAVFLKHYADQMAVLQRTKELLKDPSRASGKEPVASTEVGVMLLKMGYERQGLKWLEQALLRDPNYQPAHRTLAEFYAQKGDTQRAAAHRARLTDRPKSVSPH